MNKKILVGITTVLVSIFAAYGVSKSMNTSNTELSELTLANIEALAQCEGGGEYYDEGGFWDGVSEVFHLDYLERHSQAIDYGANEGTNVNIGVTIEGVPIGLTVQSSSTNVKYRSGIYRVECLSGPYEYCQERFYKL